MTRYLLWLVFSWRGRICQKTFILAGVSLDGLKHALYSFFPHSSAPLAIIFLIGIWAGLGLCAKRLHDFGWSARWLTPVALASIIGLLPQTFGAAGFGSPPLVITAVALLALFAALLLKKGDEAVNAYGVRTSTPSQFRAAGGDARDGV